MSSSRIKKYDNEVPVLLTDLINNWNSNFDSLDSNQDYPYHYIKHIELSTKEEGFKKIDKILNKVDRLVI